jgi:putative sigma-54 modulation protein
MHINYTARNIIIKDSVKDYLETRVEKLSRLLRTDDTSVNVCISGGKNGYCSVSIDVSNKDFMVRSQKETNRDNITDLIDEVVENIERQVIKNKAKIKKFYPGVDIIDTLEDDEPITSEFKVVREKHYQAKPMSVEEAILQMNLLGHSFFIFADEHDNRAVVYKRNKSDYGIIYIDD